MEGSRRGFVCFIVIVMMVGMLTCAMGREPLLHRVGGRQQGWRPNVNFTKWTNHERFYVGDWLYFGFDRQLYNVLEVNKTGYEKCIDTNFIKNITRGGRDVFNLTVAKPYYFLSGGGYCFHGMKLAVYVKDIPLNIPSPSRPKSNSGSSVAGSIILSYIVLAFALIWYVFIWV